MVAEDHHEVVEVLHLWGISIVEGHHPPGYCPFQGQLDNPDPSALGLEIPPWSECTGGCAPGKSPTAVARHHTLLLGGVFLSSCDALAWPGMFGGPSAAHGGLARIADAPSAPSAWSMAAGPGRSGSISSGCCCLASSFTMV